jgi:hypothetical protein
LLRNKNLTNKRYSFCQEIKVYPRRDIGFAKRENFSQKDIYVLPREKKLVKKRYRFCQKRKV